jgi:hypothetical protein
MRRCELTRLRAATSLSLLVAASLVAQPAGARDETPNRAAAAASVAPPSPSPPAAGARALKPGEEKAPLPPGHPQVNAPPEDQDEEEPGQARQAAIPGMFQPPPDTAEEDPSLPGGTLVVDIRDADNQPKPNVPLTLVVLHQSVAKGQSKENKPVKADANGQLRLDHLEIGSDVSYWVKNQSGPATFASSPVQLNPARGIHEVMHVYPVTTSLESALIVTQGVLYFEVKDDRVQVEEAVTFYNFGKTAWVPDNLILKLPSGFTAVTSQAMMSDQGIDPVEKEGAKVRGTFAPGRHDLDFRWQLPYDGERELAVDVKLPPHLAIMRVMAAAGHDTVLDVQDFPEAQKRTDRQGQRILITEKQVKRDTPLASVHIVIRGLTTAGPGRYYVCGVAAFAILLGLYLGVAEKKGVKASETSERGELLAELEELERARRRGDVGPKTYERVRRELIDAIALTLDAELA